MKNLRFIPSAVLAIGLCAYAAVSNAVEEITNEQRLEAFSKLPAAERQKPEFFAMKLVVEDSAKRVLDEPDRSKIKLLDSEEILRLDHGSNDKPNYEWIIVQKTALLNRTHIAECIPRFGENGWELSIKFTDEGKKVFGHATQKAVGHRIALVIGGSIVLSAPNINEPILGGEATISGGNLDEFAARNIAAFFEYP